jgi:polyferredoxin
MMQGIPTWLFYTASAVIMTVSFLVFALSARKETAAPKGYATIDLLRVTWVRKLLCSPFLKFCVRGVVTGLFILIILTGLFGTRFPGANLSTVLTWTIWWILLILLIAFLGKAWCFLCPWDAISWWLERLSLWKITPETLSLNLKWPRRWRNIYPAVFLFILLTWLELGWGVTRRPEVTAYLALLMLFLAFIPAFIFERRGFCQHGCLIGRISGLYALFSPIEIRARNKEICLHACQTKECLTGNEKGYGCPTFQYLGTMDKNTYCIFCAECFRTCPEDNVA